MVDWDKCSACGFLGLRNDQNRNIEEAEEAVRITGATHNRYNKIPLCFKRSRDFIKDFIDLGVEYKKIEPEHILGLISKDIQCNEYTKWYQGFTPKEHQEMLDRQWKLDQEEKRKISDRNWHIFEIVLIVFLSGLFTLLGAFISRP